MIELGRFQVVREIGRGGMGVVYEVRDPERPDRALALKLMHLGADQEATLRFAREAQALARVQHRGVVGVHTFDRTPRGESYLLTDLVPGRDLAAQVAATGPLTPRDAAAFMHEVADAMSAVHAAGVIHRDLKPGNILVRPDGAPVIIDFGLARALEGSRLTATGTVLGTVAFMPPEQADGSAVDARADVYGLGATLYWLLTGQAPFGGPPAQALYALINKAPPWPRELDPTVPRGLDAICRRAMEKEPRARHADAAALRDDLARWLANGDPPERRGVGVLGLVAIVGLAATLALALARRGADPNEVPSIATPATSVVTSPPPAIPPPPRVAAPPPAVDPAWRRALSARPFEGGDDRVHVRFLDDDRLVMLGGKPSFVSIQAVSRAPTTPPPLDLGLDGEGRGLAVVRAGPGRVLLSTTVSLWSCDGERATRLWTTTNALGDLDLIAFEPATGRAVVVDNALVPDVSAPGPQLLELSGASATAVGRLEPCGTRRTALEVCGGRFLVARRGVYQGELLQWAPGASSPTTLALDLVSTVNGFADLPLAAVGLRDHGQLVLCDLRGATPRRLATIQMNPTRLAVTSSQVLASAFGAGRLWAATTRAVWSWRLDPVAVLADPARASSDEDAVWMLPADFGSPSSIDLSPDETLLAVGSSTGKVLIRGVDASNR